MRPGRAFAVRYIDAVVLGLLLMLPLLLGAAAVPSLLDPAVAPRLACFIDADPAVPRDRRSCVGTAPPPRRRPGPEQTPAWMAAGLEHAFKLFAPADVGFVVVGIDAVGPEFAVMRHRRAARRDRARALQRGGHPRVLGRPARRRRRRPARRSAGSTGASAATPTSAGSSCRRSARAWSLAHELGHFFGLPHSRYARQHHEQAPARAAALGRARVCARGARDRVEASVTHVSRRVDSNSVDPASLERRCVSCRRGAGRQARRRKSRYIVSAWYDWVFFLFPPLLALFVGMGISGTPFAD